MAYLVLRNGSFSSVPMMHNSLPKSVACSAKSAAEQARRHAVKARTRSQSPLSDRHLLNTLHAYSTMPCLGRSCADTEGSFSFSFMELFPPVSELNQSYLMELCTNHFLPCLVIPCDLWE